MMFKCVFLAVLASTAWARTASSTINEIPQEEARSEVSYLTDLRHAYKVYQECAAADLSTCLKLKLIAAMDRASRTFNEVSFLDGIVFVKDPKAPEQASAKTEAELEASLPRILGDREDALNTMLADRVSSFFDTHSIQIKLPSANDMEESRGKKKKSGGLFLIPLVLGGTLIPLALGGLALLAGKALIVAKIALVLAGIIALKKLFSGGHGGGGGGHESGHEIYTGGHGGSGWGRSYDKEQAQKMAYSAYVAKTTR